MKNTISIVCVFLCLTFASFVFAVDPIYNTGSKDLAIRGYDTVAYFTQGEAVKGEKTIAHEYKGVTWLFSSEDNKKLFMDKPESYEPQYGGYCAYAVSRGSAASIKPKLFTIHNDKLYLNYNAGVQKKWLGDIDDRIAKADKNWPEILAK